MSQYYPENLPRHVAIIMDGNGRWAQRRFRPRISGHRAGIEAVRRTVRACAEKGLEVLTLFAFSSENWRRPKDEVGPLMDLFVDALEAEIKSLHESGIRLRVIGDRSAFGDRLRGRILEAEGLTEANPGLQLVIAANYGGRWDISDAIRRLLAAAQTGRLGPEDVSDELISSHLSLAGLPDPDLFIRTGGEQRLSNFLLWHLAYSELYFTDVLWPEFGREHLDEALRWFASRQRRFGRTGEQVVAARRG